MVDIFISLLFVERADVDYFMPTKTLQEIAIESIAWSRCYHYSYFVAKY
jgi:hypothetical protein